MKATFVNSEDVVGLYIDDVLMLEDFNLNICKQLFEDLHFEIVTKKANEKWIQYNDFKYPENLNDVVFDEAR